MKHTKSYDEIIHELQQEVIILEEIEKMLQNNHIQTLKTKESLEKKIMELLHQNNELKQEKEIFKQTSNDKTYEINSSQVKQTSKIIRELEQEREIIHQINSSLFTKLEQLEKENKKLQTQLAGDIHKHKEIEQENIVLDELNIDAEKKSRLIYKKHYLMIALVVIVSSGLFVGYSVFVSTQMTYKIQYEPVNSSFVIQNLRGDTIDTWLHWSLLPASTLNIAIISESESNEDQIQGVKDAIASSKSIEIDDSLLHKGPSGSKSTYFIGWQGVMNHLSDTETQWNLPTRFEFLDNDKEAADITIRLVDFKNADGYHGYTKSTVDENRILKTNITIYDVKETSLERLKIITRHEFGHALGLAHSTAPEDLMAPIITTEYPYISQCAIDALVGLYNGDTNSQVVCVK